MISTTLISRRSQENEQNAESFAAFYLAIRHMSLNILRRDATVKENLRGKRLHAGWDEQVLTACGQDFAVYEHAIALLNERDRRRYAAVEAAKLGQGGMECISR